MKTRSQDNTRVILEQPVKRILSGVERNPTSQTCLGSDMILLSTGASDVKMEETS